MLPSLASVVIAKTTPLYMLTQILSPLDRKNTLYRAKMQYHYGSKMIKTGNTCNANCEDS